MKIVSLLFATSALAATTNAALRGSGTVSSATTSLKGQVVECRVTINTVMEEIVVAADKEQNHAPEIVCLPINVEGEETDGVFPISLPEELVELHKKSISSGQLYLKINGAVHVQDESLEVDEYAEFEVYDPRTLPNHLRRLEEGRRRKLQAASGPKQVAIVRIKTADNKVTDFSATELIDGLFGNGVNKDGITFANQYDKCSNGKISFSLSEPVIELKLTKQLSQYSVASMQTEVQKTIKAQRGLGSMAQLADFTMFIMPEGMGFTAGAPVGHWRSSYHNRWGLSLAGTMHEVGHNMGLGHAWENGKAYEDYSGYMAAGTTATNEPQTCFNGFNMRSLGWFDDKTEAIESSGFSNGEAKLYKLSAYVDYDRAEVFEPVLLDIDDGSLVLQYNRKARHNIGTREKGNLLTITESESSAQAASNMVKGLDVGQEYTRGSLKVSVCSKVTGSGNNPDALIVSVGNNSDACNEEWTPPTEDSGTSFQIDMSVTETADRATTI